MPQTSIAPARLFETRMWVNMSDVEGLDDCMWTPAAIDLEHVESVRSKIDEATRAPDPEICLIHVAGRVVRIGTPYAKVLTAWLAYRTHADALGRLRN